jgi:hypothetical protein
MEPTQAVFDLSSGSSKRYHFTLLRTRIKERNVTMFAVSKPLFVLLTVILLGATLEKESNTPTSGAPEYTTDSQLKLPKHYREWIYLTSNYYAPSDTTKLQAGGQRGFNDVFVNPDAYRAFMQTGTWPDKTMLAVDMREAVDMEAANPNQNGIAQSSETLLAVHVKDEARFPGKWAFFSFSGGATTGKMIPVTADCYSCHSARGAEDTTFVQYYPTLLPIAKGRNTLSPAYLRKHEAPPSMNK